MTIAIIILGEQKQPPVRSRLDTHVVLGNRPQPLRAQTGINDLFRAPDSLWVSINVIAEAILADHLIGPCNSNPVVAEVNDRRSLLCRSRDPRRKNGAGRIPRLVIRRGGPD